MLHWFQAHNIVIWQLYMLCCAPPTVAPIYHHTTWLQLWYHWLYSLCCTLYPCDLTHSVTGNVDLPLPFTHFARPCTLSPLAIITLFSTAVLLFDLKWLWFSTDLVVIDLFSKKRKTLADAWHSSLKGYFCNTVIKLGSICQFYFIY